jgi:Fe2+ or Zn2+ uptake regulation protein
MSETRITEQRKRFAEILGKYPRVTFSLLKQELVDVKEYRMNLATLYRIVDAFKAQGLLHEITVAGERVIIPCQCEHATQNDAITITFCENCGAIYDTHSRLNPPYTMSETVARVKSCKMCMIQ